MLQQLKEYQESIDINLGNFAKPKPSKILQVDEDDEVYVSPGKNY